MSKIKHYETMFILKPTLTEEETVAQIENIRAIIEKNGGTIVSADNVGQRELAYEIEKCKRWADKRESRPKNIQNERTRCAT